MHFRDFFYKGYFRSLNLQKPFTDEIKRQNVPAIKTANNALKEAALQSADYALLVHGLPANISMPPLNITTTYPGLILGTGYMHETLNEGEFKLGFYFDCATGLPCIPGSSIKGVLRSLFPQFREKHPYKSISAVNEIQSGKVNFIADQLGWKDKPDKALAVHQLEQVIFEGVDLEKTKINFDNGNDEIEYSSIYRRFCFYNGYISNAPGNKIFEIDTITPHNENPLKNPTPLNFLKIRPNVTFTLQIHINIIETLALETDEIRKLIKAILKLSGIGAKTNVGYGQFKQHS